MNFTNCFVSACFSSEKPAQSALVERAPGDYIGPYPLECARAVAADLGGAAIIDADTGEILH